MKMKKCVHMKEGKKVTEIKKIGAATPIKLSSDYQKEIIRNITNLKNMESIRLYIHINILFTVPHLEHEQYEFLKKLESIYGRYDDG